MDQKHISSRSEGDHVDSKQEEVKYTKILKTSVVVADDGVEYHSITNESHFLDLPFHILELIMKHCLGVEYVNLRATCKRCHLAAPLIKWSNQTTRMRLQIYSSVSPWLIVSDDKQGKIAFKHPIIGDKYFEERFPVSINRICYSMFGWLLCYDTSGYLVFFNPFTSDIHRLPSVRYNLKSLCFSAPPTSPDCMVVGFSERHVFIHFLARKQSWRMFSLRFRGADSYSQTLNVHSPTYNGRDLYVLSNKGQLNVFKDLGEEDYFRKQVVAEAPISRCKSYAQYHLMKCDQQLLLVIVGEGGETVEVFAIKMKDSEKKWKKVYGLGKHMIYVCQATCCCIEAKSPEMENKIYFPQVHYGNEKIAFYSLESCNYHTFNNDKKIEDWFVNFSETIDHLFPYAWIEPKL